ncbi:MAG: GNAT family N-acetyltransferase [Clostridiales bacterium]|nr:GNAT family N-acetyltransferase [Clostridiales bacterium]
MMIIPADDRVADCISVRREVFVNEQGVPEELEIDSLDEPGSGCEHFLILDDAGSPIGTFRAYYETCDRVHLQRFCIKKSARKKGAGRAAFAFVENHYAAKGVKKITFGAQCTAIPFYEKCGCVCVSDVFLDAGLPHRTMEKSIG